MRYLDSKGAPTAEARRDRPDFMALGTPALPFQPDATDLDIMYEAFYVATINVRIPVLSALLDAGFPVDYAPWGATMLHTSIGLFCPPLVDFFLKRGADPDIIALYNGSARQFGIGLADWMAKPAPQECLGIRDIFQALPPKPEGPDKFASMAVKI
jgi:hypothetical protein